MLCAKNGDWLPKDQSKSEIFPIQSADKELRIQVWGEQVFLFEPWKVFVAIVDRSEKDTVSTKLHADAVDAT
jgi:hypothetical protein